MAQLPGGELMRRAACGLAATIARLVDAVAADNDGSPVSVVGLVGRGNNGGDTAYSLAYLRDHTAVPFTPAAILVDGRGHEAGVEAARAVGAHVIDAQANPGAAAQILGHADVVVDGITGTGGRPGLSDLAAGVVDHVPDQAVVVAVDIPSGADPDGAPDDARCLPADHTVTFGCLKPVHLSAPTVCGEITLIDIGLDMRENPTLVRLDARDVPSLWPRPGRDDDKYSRGVLGVVAGGERYTGAAVLAVEAAVEAGAGLVRYVGPPNPTALVRHLVPEAVHGMPPDDRVDAWVIGPGLDVDDDSPAGLEQVAAARHALESDTSCVVDAGGLDLLTGPRASGAPLLLTPHAAELARLLTRLDPLLRSAGASSRPVGARGERLDLPDLSGPLTADDVRRHPWSWAGHAADLLGATVLLKGATTYVVPPAASDEPTRVQDQAPTWTATAGAGDVLAGLAGMLLAAGLSPLDAGSLAALVHGLAAHDANPGGPVRAGAIARMVPSTVAALLTGRERPGARRPDGRPVSAR